MSPKKKYRYRRASKKSGSPRCRLCIKGETPVILGRKWWAESGGKCTMFEDQLFELSNGVSPKPESYRVRADHVCDFFERRPACLSEN